MAAGSEYQLAIKIAGKLDRSFNTAVKQASTTLKALGAVGSTIGSSVKIAANVFTATSAAVVGVGVASVKAGAEFDSAMSQVAATMGKTMQGMQEEVGTVDLAWGKFSGNLREYALEMGEHTAFSATQSAEALNYMALAGYDTQTSMSMLPNVLNLAAAGSMDLATASDMVTDTQTAFGITLERTSQMVDEMAKAASTGNTSVSQLGDAFLTVGGLAQELNGGIVKLSDGTISSVDGVQELEIALTAMANAGIKGSEAGTHMRNMLLKLSSPTDSGTKALEALGVSVFDAEGKMRSLSDIFGDLSSSMGNLTQEEKLQAISDLFNTRDTATAEALLNAVGQDWDQIGESILNAEGAAQQMADVQLDNLAGDVTLFKSALEGVEIAISDTVNPALRNMVQFGTEQLGVLSEAIKTGGLAGLSGALGGVMSDALVEVSSYASDILNVIFSISDGLFQGLQSNGPKLASGAAALAAQFLSGFIQYYGEFWTTGAALLAQFLHGMVGQIPQIIRSGVQMVQNLSQGLTSQFPAILTAAGQIGLGLIQGIAAIAPGLLSMGGTLLLQLAQGIMNALPVVTNAAMNIMANFGQYLQANLPTLMATGLNMILALSGSIRENAGKLVDGAINLALNLAQGLADSIPVIISTVPTIVSSIAGVINDNAPKLLSAGVRIIATLAGGIIRSIPVIVANIPKILRAIYDVFTAFNWLSLGRTAVAAIGRGFSSLITSIPGILKNIPYVIGELFETGANIIQNFGWASLGRGIVQTIILGLSSLPSMFLNLGRMAVQWFLSIDWIGLGGEILGSIVSGIVGLGGAAFDAVKGIGSGIWDSVTGLFTGGNTEAVDAAVSSLESSAPVVKEATGRVTDMATSGLQFDGAQLSQFGTDANRFLADGISSSASLASTAASDSGTAAMDSFVSSIDASTSAIESSAALTSTTFTDSMSSGLLAGEATLSGTASNLGETATTVLSDSITDNLSAVDAAAQASGAAITSGFNSGIGSGMSDANSNAETFSTVASSISQSADTITATVQQLSSTITSTLDQCWANVAASTSSAWDSITSGLESSIAGTAASISASMSQVPSAMLNGISTTAASTVTTSMSEIRVSVTSAMNAALVATRISFTQMTAVTTMQMGASRRAVSTSVIAMRADFVSALSAILSTTRSTFTGVYTTIATQMNRARSAVQSAVSAMKGAMRFSWSLPKLKLPHPSVSGKFSLNPPSVPKFGISWYKQGGILDGAQIFGMAGNTMLGGGEAGKEAVLPLAELWSQMRDIMSEVLRTNDAAPPPTDVLDLLAEKLQSMTGQSPIAQVLDDLIGGGPQPQPATANGAPPPPIQITYAPSYHFEGDAPSRDDMTEAARMSQEEFEERIRRWMRDNDRVAF